MLNETRSWCPHCLEVSEPHRHGWTEPDRCTATVETANGERYRCELYSGHNEGKFPRPDWNNGKNGVMRYLMNATDHKITWKETND